MGQEEILKILNKHPGQYMSIPDLCKFINVNRNSISRACKTLVKFGEVNFKTENKSQFVRYLFAVRNESRYIYKQKKHSKQHECS